MSQELYIQIGVGGILAIQIVRTVLESMPKIIGKNGNGNGAKTSGEMDPAYWQLEFRNAVKEGLSATAIPVLERQTQILEDIKELQKEILRQALRRRET